MRAARHNSRADSVRLPILPVVGHISVVHYCYMAKRSDVDNGDPPLRVLLADDHTRVLAGAKNLLDPDCEVVASVSNGRMALEAVRKLGPDLVVLDIELPEMDGIRVAREIRRLGLKVCILFLTVYSDEDYIAAARTLGTGYVLKSRMATDLHHAIEEAIAGRFFVSQRRS
jgi:DNA-binding NarL/FixJ family response regulator